MQLPDPVNIDVFAADFAVGDYPVQITPELVYRNTLAFLDQNGPGKYLLVRDMRQCSLVLTKAALQACLERQCQVIYYDICAFDLFQFTISHSEFQGGIWIGAPFGTYNKAGFRFLGCKAYPVDHIALKVHAESFATALHPEYLNLDPFTYKPETTFLKDYFFSALKTVDPMSWRKLRIVIDGGNGLGGDLLRKLFLKIPQIEIITMNTEPDEFFPHHLPNPLNPENNQGLADKVIALKADLGVALDYDGDTFICIDETGRQVSPSLCAALLTKIILLHTPQAKIGHDYQQIYAIEHAIFSNQGQNIPVHSGYAEFKKVVSELGVDFAAESDGRYFFREMEHGCSAFYAVLQLLEYLNQHEQTLSQALHEFREQSSQSDQLSFVLAQGTDWNTLKNICTDLFQEARPNENDGLLLEDENYRISVKLYRGIFAKVYIEASSDLLLHELQYRLLTKFQDFSIETHGVCDELDLVCLTTSDRDKFETLLNNLWFTWNPHYIMPLIDMYGDGWRKNLPPEALIANYGKDRLNQILQEKHWELSQDLRLFKEYFVRPTKFDQVYGSDPRFARLKTNPVAYFCMEFGLVDWLQIYSGGLGILAGDYMKQTSDLGVPVVGVGIFYHQGYLHQDFGPDGSQVEDYIHQEPMDFNMELVRDAAGKVLLIEVILDNRAVEVRAWRQKLGRNDLYLLDTNFEENEEWEDRLITGYLYGGDLENRIRQEIVLGIAGARLLEQLGIKPAVYHMNEGHSGFLVIERVRQIMQEQNISFNDALKQASQSLVFTNHTLKSAGNDIFDYMLFEKYLQPYASEIKTDVNTLFNLGDDKTYSQGGFSMTIFGLRHAKVSNAVSKLHATAAANIWHEYSLTPVTNGVHMPTWVSPEIHKLLDQYLGEEWHYASTDMDFQRILKIPKQLLWEAHNIRKQKLIHSLNSELGLSLKPDILTIAWSRRLAQYKRPDLLISDVERLKAIVASTDKPVQILIAGKSHPKDTIGKQILQKMNQYFENEFFNNKVEIIPGYNWQLARRMVSGADIWLNTPYRYEEACGTSGMKAAANGVIQLTTKDGWTDEVDWFRIGWVISEQDSADSLYSLLQNDIVPLYYNKNESGFNEDWLSMMLNSIQLSLQNFSAERMVRDYLDKIYNQVL